MLLIPALEKIISNSSWRKHSKLGHECKSLLDHLTSPPKSPKSPNSPQAVTPGVLYGSGSNELSLTESELILSPFIKACNSGDVKIDEPTLDCVQKLIAYGYLQGESDPNGGDDSKLLANLIEVVCKCCELNDEGVDLLVLKTILSAVTSIQLRIHGDSLLQIVRSCYDVYLGSRNVVNQTTAKASLVQMLVIVFRRIEADSSTVPVQPIVVTELMEPLEKGGDDDGFVQGFISKVMMEIDGVLNQGTGSGSGVGVNGGGVHNGAFETRTSTTESTHPADLLDSTDKDIGSALDETGGYLVALDVLLGI